MYFAPPDLFSRRQETGKSAIDIFLRHGIHFYKTDNARVNGWYELKEWLRLRKDIDGTLQPRLKIYENCRNLIRTLPALVYDRINVNDVAKNPHELTHAPDALRGFVMSAAAKPEGRKDTRFIENEYSDFLSYGG